MERRYGCRETVLPVLSGINHSCHALREHEVLHRLKLVTGVDISTRPVRRLGREGKAKKRTSLRTAAEANRVAFRRSIAMLNVSICTPVSMCAFTDIGLLAPLDQLGLSPFGLAPSAYYGLTAISRKLSATSLVFNVPYIYIYILYIPNLGLRIVVSVRERV